MDQTFASMLETIRFLGGLQYRTKEETLTYDRILAYAGALARLNTDQINTELTRREDAYYDKRRLEKVEEEYR